MPENPLLPHRKLQELYTLMERSRVLERKNGQAAAREALLAATTIQLAPGDMLAASPEDHTAAQLAPLPKQPGTHTASFQPSLARLPLCAATARGLQGAGNNGVLLALTSAGVAEAGWPEALAWAQADRLPFILAVADSSAGRSSRRASSKTEPLTWPNLSRACKRLQLPTLSVDGEDAVAVFRVAQEAALRARTGAGPSVIWAILSPARANLKPSELPLARLKRYMAAREIPLPR